MENTVKWIKFSVAMFDNEKILLIETMPSADTILVIWFKLLALAGKQNNNGVFMLNDLVPYDAEMLAGVVKRDINTVKLALHTFERFGMIEIIDDVIAITNWAKYQNVERLDELRELSDPIGRDERKREKHRERQKQYRERQKLKAAERDSNVTLGDACVTLGDVTRDACVTQNVTLVTEKEKRSKKEKDTELEEDIDIEIIYTDLKENTNTLSTTNFRAPNTVGFTKEDERVREQNRLRKDFKRIWKIYPRKEGYGEAWEEFKKLWPKSRLVDEMLKSIEKQSQSQQWKAENGRFVPQLRTWLKGKRWKDKPTESTESSSSFEGDEFIEAALNRGFDD